MRPTNCADELLERVLHAKRFSLTPRVISLTQFVDAVVNNSSAQAEKIVGKSGKNRRESGNNFVGKPSEFRRQVANNFVGKP